MSDKFVFMKECELIFFVPTVYSLFGRLVAIF